MKTKSLFLTLFASVVLYAVNAFSQCSAPTVSAGAGAGSGASATLTGSDLSGQVSIQNKNGGSASSAVFTVTFSAHSSLNCVVSPATGATVSNTSASTFYVVNNGSSFSLYTFYASQFSGWSGDPAWSYVCQ